jgi:hypothetical protein
MQGHLRKYIADPTIGILQASKRAMVERWEDIKISPHRGHDSRDNGQLLRCLVGVESDRAEDGVK